MHSKSLTVFSITFLLASLSFPTLTHGEDSPVPPARKVEFAKDAASPADHAKTLKTSTGIDVDVSALAAKPIVLPTEKLDFWIALERLAAATDSRIVTTGGRISLKPGKSQAASFVSGPFRFVVRGINAGIDSESGRSGYEVTLDVAWEPWLLAYRIDSSPSNVKAFDAKSEELAVAKGGTRTLTTGNTASVSVRPSVAREHKSISLKGSVLVTIADEMLTFTIDANKPQAIPPQKGVTVAVSKSGVDGAHWFAEFDVKYPKSNVVMESHEYALLRNNVVRLINPKGEAFKADIEEQADSRFTFKNRANQVGPGWKVEYGTPGPMREIVVPFELKDIKLP
jgi:hypothetical protein